MPSGDHLPQARQVCADLGRRFEQRGVTPGPACQEDRESCQRLIVDLLRQVVPQRSAGSRVCVFHVT